MMTVLLVLLGVIGIVVIGLLNRRRSPSPVSHDGASGGSYPIWMDSGGSTSGATDCAPGAADCGDGGGGGGGGE
jgi:hypothetical protein